MNPSFWTYPDIVLFSWMDCCIYKNCLSLNHSVRTHCASQPWPHKHTFQGLRESCPHESPCIIIFVSYPLPVMSITLSTPKVMLWQVWHMYAEWFAFSSVVPQYGDHLILYRFLQAQFHCHPSKVKCLGRGSTLQSAKSQNLDPTPPKNSPKQHLTVEWQEVF